MSEPRVYPIQVCRECGFRVSARGLHEASQAELDAGLLPCGRAEPITILVAPEAELDRLRGERDHAVGQVEAREATIRVKDNAHAETRARAESAEARLKWLESDEAVETITEAVVHANRATGHLFPSARARRIRDALLAALPSTEQPPEPECFTCPPDAPGTDPDCPVHEQPANGIARARELARSLATDDSLGVIHPGVKRVAEQIVEALGRPTGGGVWCQRCGEMIPDPNCPECRGTGVPQPASKASGRLVDRDEFLAEVVEFLRDNAERALTEEARYFNCSIASLIERRFGATTGEGEERR